VADNGEPQPWQVLILGRRLHQGIGSIDLAASWICLLILPPT